MLPTLTSILLLRLVQDILCELPMVRVSLVLLSTIIPILVSEWIMPIRATVCSSLSHVLRYEEIHMRVSDTVRQEPGEAGQRYMQDMLTLSRGPEYRASRRLYQDTVSRMRSIFPRLRQLQGSSISSQIKVQPVISEPIRAIHCRLSLLMEERQRCHFIEVVLMRSIWVSIQTISSVSEDGQRARTVSSSI